MKDIDFEKNLEKDKFSLNSTQNTPVSSSSTVTSTLESEINSIQLLVIRDFIRSWYADFSYNSEFLKEVKCILQEISNDIKLRIAHQNSKIVLTSIIQLYLIHLTSFRKAKSLYESHRIHPKTKVPLDSKVKRHSSVEEAFQYSNEFHIALQSKDMELKYLKEIVTVITFALFQKEVTQGPCSRTLLIEVLTNKLLYPIMQMISEPDWFAEVIIKLTSDEQLVCDVKIDEEVICKATNSSDKVVESCVNDDFLETTLMGETEKLVEMNEDRNLTSQKSNLLISDSSENKTINNEIVQENSDCAHLLTSQGDCSTTCSVVPTVSAISDIKSNESDGDNEDKTMENVSISTNDQFPSVESSYEDSLEKTLLCDSLEKELQNSLETDEKSHSQSQSSDGSVEVAHNPQMILSYQSGDRVFSESTSSSERKTRLSSTGSESTLTDSESGSSIRKFSFKKMFPSFRSSSAQSLKKPESLPLVSSKDEARDRSETVPIVFLNNQPLSDIKTKPMALSSHGHNSCGSESESDCTPSPVSFSSLGNFLSFGSSSNVGSEDSTEMSHSLSLQSASSTNLKDVENLYLEDSGLFIDDNRRIFQDISINSTEIIDEHRSSNQFCLYIIEVNIFSILFFTNNNYFNLITVFIFYDVTPVTFLLFILAFTFFIHLAYFDLLTLCKKNKDQLGYGHCKKSKIS